MLTAKAKAAEMLSAQARPHQRFGGRHGFAQASGVRVGCSDRHERRLPPSVASRRLPRDTGEEEHLILFEKSLDLKEAKALNPPPFTGEGLIELGFNHARSAAEGVAFASICRS